MVLKNQKEKTTFMIKILAITAAVLAIVTIVWSWVRGIEYMQKNHPDYKGEDFFGEE